MADTRQQLVKAFDLIKKDQTEEATALLKPIVAAEPDNKDAWWLMANAAGEPRDARRALVNVLKIDPAHAKARDLLDKLNEQFPPSDEELMKMLEIEDAAPPPFATATDEGTGFEDDVAEGEDDPFKSDIDDLFKEDFEPLPSAEEANRAALRGSDDDFGLAPGEDPFAELLERDDAEQAGRSRGGLRRILLPLMIIVLLLVVVIAFMFMRGGDDTGEPEVNLVDPGGLTPVDAAAVNADNAPVLEAARVDTENEAKSAILSDATAVFAEINGGYALIVRICSEPGPALPQLATQGIQIAAQRAGSSPAISSLLSSVGVSVEDCLRGNDTLYRATAPIQAAVDFSANSGGDALNTFRQTWTVQS